MAIKRALVIDKSAALLSGGGWRRLPTPSRFALGRRRQAHAFLTRPIWFTHKNSLSQCSVVAYEKIAQILQMSTKRALSLDTSEAIHRLNFGLSRAGRRRWAAQRSPRFSVFSFPNFFFAVLRLLCLFLSSLTCHHHFLFHTSLRFPLFASA